MLADVRTGCCLAEGWLARWRAGLMTACWLIGGDWVDVMMSDWMFGYLANRMADWLLNRWARLLTGWLDVSIAGSPADG